VNGSEFPDRPEAKRAGTAVRNDARRQLRAGVGSFLFVRDLYPKPVPTFRDHAAFSLCVIFSENR
jgi:hypothetical protein